MTALPIDSIILADRTRRRLGDIDALARSIEAVGLLHPVVVDPEHRLIAGGRRLAAARKLGWTEVPVTIAANAADALVAAQAERDENACRLALAPSEAVAIGQRIEELERPLARERQRTENHPTLRMTQAEQSEDTEAQPAWVNLTQGQERGPRVDDIAAEAVGMGRVTYAKAKKVVALASDPDAPPAVRAVAERAVAQMDETGKVDGPYKAVQGAVYDATGDPEAARYLLRGNIAKYQNRLLQGLLALSPEHCAAACEDEHGWESWEWLAKHTADWFDALFKARPKPGLRVVEGNG